MSDGPLTAETVAGLVRTQFPAVAAATVEGPRFGTSNDSFLIDGRWVFRFPKDREAVDELARERLVLARIADAMPAAVPRFEHLGTPSAAFPRPFVGYRAIPGEALLPERLAALAPAARARVAAGIGRFLGALHAVPLAEIETAAKERGLVFFDDSDPSPHDTGLVRLRLARQLEAARGHPRWAEAERLVTPLLEDDELGRVRVLRHGDLSEHHLLVDLERGLLRGVIDWGNVRFGEAFDEFGQLVDCYDETFVDEILDSYPQPAGEALRHRLFRLLPSAEERAFIRSVLDPRKAG